MQALMLRSTSSHHMERLMPKNRVKEEMKGQNREHWRKKNLLKMKDYTHSQVVMAAMIWALEHFDKNLGKGHFKVCRT